MKWSSTAWKIGWGLLTSVWSPRAEVPGGQEPLHLGAEKLSCFSRPCTCALYEHYEGCCLYRNAMKAAPFIQTLWRLFPLYEHYEGCSIYMNIIKAVSFTVEEGCFPFLPSVYSLAGPCIHSSGIKLNVMSWTPKWVGICCHTIPFKELMKTIRT